MKDFELNTDKLLEMNESELRNEVISLVHRLEFSNRINKENLEYLQTMFESQEKQTVELLKKWDKNEIR